MNPLARRILLIDDQQAIHEDYRKVLGLRKQGDVALNQAAASLFEDSPLGPVVWEGFELDSALQGEEGFELVRRSLEEGRPYAMAFVDIRMPPGWDGVQTVRRIWEVDPEILVVICSAYSDYSWEDMVSQLGRNDRFLILKKPFDNIEIRQCAMVLSERWSVSRTDILTGLLNRRAFSGHAELEWNRSLRHELPLSCAMIDLDFFKHINDDFGHTAGDVVLKLVAQQLQKQSRSSELVCRYGGEEFCVLLPHTSEEGAAIWAEHARQVLAAMPATIGNRPVQVTASFGVAERRAEDDRVETLIDRADQALLAAKKSGRNQVVRSTGLAKQALGENGSAVPALTENAHSRLLHSAQEIAQCADELSNFVSNHAEVSESPTLDRATKLQEMINLLLSNMNQHNLPMLVCAGISPQPAPPAGMTFDSEVAGTSDRTVSLEDNYRILIIDDDESIHADFRKVIGTDGPHNENLDSAADALFDRAPLEHSLQRRYEIDSSTQGQEGLARVEESIAQGRPYAMAFVDMRMPPGWNGIETVRQIWRVDPDLQIVICTAYSDYSWSEVIRDLGETDRLLILKKPFDNIEVRQIALALCAKWNSARQASRNLQELQEMVRQQTSAIYSAHEETIYRLVRASLCRDEETGAHIRRTGLYSELLAATAGWDAEHINQIRLAAPMHDVGKIGIPDAILRKPGPLTPEDTALMRTHTALGANLLSGSASPVLRMAREIAMYHHERWDGTGYPAGLAGPQIPESARIVAVVDVYDALSHDRVYRKEMPEAEVLKIMRSGRGTHFEPRLLDAFISLLPEMRAIAMAVPDLAEEDPWFLPTFPPQTLPVPAAR